MWRWLRLTQTQWRAWIAADRVFDQRLECCRQFRLQLHRALASATRAAGCRPDLVVALPQLLDRAIDRAARKTGRNRSRRDAPPTPVPRSPQTAAGRARRETRPF